MAGENQLLVFSILWHYEANRMDTPSRDDENLIAKNLNKNAGASARIITVDRGTEG